MNTHVDMSKFIAPKSDQLNADDLIGGPRTITVTRVSGNEGNAEQPVNVYFEGDDGKPFRPCKSMRRVMVKIWGADAAKYVGRSMTIFRDPKVKWGGMEVGGIRISAMTGLEKPETMALTETRSSRKPYVVQPLKVEQKVDKAAEGAAALIARIEAGEVVDGDAKATTQRDWLAKNRPDLAAKVDAAIALQELAAEPDDNPFADDTIDLEGAVAEIEGLLNVANDDATLAAADAKFAEHRAALPDDIAADLDAKLAARRTQIEA